METCMKCRKKVEHVDSMSGWCNECENEHRHRQSVWSEYDEDDDDE